MSTFIFSSFKLTFLCLTIKYAVVDLFFVMVFNATLWQSDLLVEETEVPGENHQPAAGH
jgi:hypothetical protein